MGPAGRPETMVLQWSPLRVAVYLAGSGVIDWHITLKGDAAVTATDDSGNTSAPVSCLVPPAPK